MEHGNKLPTLELEVKIYLTPVHLLSLSKKLILHKFEQTSCQNKLFPRIR